MYSPYSIDATKLLGELHDDTDEQRSAKSRRAQKLSHGDGRLSLLGALLRPHLFDILLHLGTFMSEVVS